MNGPSSYQSVLMVCNSSSCSSPPSPCKEFYFTLGLVFLLLLHYDSHKYMDEEAFTKLHAI